MSIHTAICALTHRVNSPCSQWLGIVRLIRYSLCIFSQGREFQQMISDTFNITWVAGALLYFSFASCLAVTDYRTGLLPDSLTLSLLWLGLIFHTIIHPDKLADAIYGAASGYLSLWLLFWCFFCLSKREGLGYGDFKFLAAIGAWNGWQSLPLILVIASTAGVINFLILHIRQPKRSGTFPFGPWLAIAGWGEFIWQI